MKNPQSSINRLLASLVAELEAGKRTLACLEAQREAIQRREPEAFETATTELEAELGARTERKRERDAVVGDLADAWGVPAAELSLSAIAARAGANGQQLLAVRAELRSVTAGVLRANRLLGALIGMHRRVLRDVVENLFEEDGAGAPAGRGALVDAEA